MLEVYRAIVEEGPDLFSLHEMTEDARFRYGTKLRLQ